LRSVHPGRLCRPWAGVLMALLAWSVLAPDVARAGCAHEGISLSRPDGYFEHLSRAGALPAPAERDDRPGPCPGGICSRAPTIPAAPVLAPPTPVESWACLAPVPPLPIPGPGASIFDEIPVLPIRSGPAIFHPPRPHALPSGIR
jgi:hypothetical protein